MYYQTFAVNKSIYLFFQELTEEGLPFLILFHHPDDKETVETYTQEVAKQILHEKGNLIRKCHSVLFITN